MTKRNPDKIVSVAAGIVVIAGLYVIIGLLILPRVDILHKDKEQWRQALASLPKLPPHPTVFPTVRGKVVPTLNLQEAMESTPQAVAAGKKLYARCVACHGANGKGDGPAAVALKPKPRNFTSPKGWTNGYTVADIFKTLSKGVPGTGMPSFDTLSVKDRFDLAHYVQSQGKFNHGKDTPAEIAALDKTFHLSGGVQQPNQVAVPVIMRHMEAEFRAPAPIPVPPASDRSEGARLVRRLVENPHRAALVLAQVPDWRKDLDALVDAVSAATPSSGFNPTAATLNKQQWASFQAELVRLTAPADPRERRRTRGRAGSNGLPVSGRE